MVAFARWVLLAASAMLIAGCATLTGNDPLQVNVAGIEPLEGEGLEMRMMVKLRVQNPNDAPIDYRGVALEMNVQGKAFASGVSDASGNVPGFGDAVISVPVTISAFRMASRAIDMAKGNTGKITYELKGKLGGSTFGAARFSTKGELDIPTTIGSAQ